MGKRIISVKRHTKPRIISVKRRRRGKNILSIPLEIIGLARGHKRDPYAKYSWVNPILRGDPF